VGNVDKFETRRHGKILSVDNLAGKKLEDIREICSIGAFFSIYKIDKQFL